MRHYHPALHERMGVGAVQTPRLQAEGVLAKRNNTTTLPLAALLFIVSGFAPISARPSESSLPPYEIENTQVARIHSSRLKRTYPIFIKLPRSYARRPEARYPVLFLHDAPYAFPLVCSLTRQMGGGGRIGEMLIVGIGYSDGDDGGVSRTRDYTPTHSPDEPIGHSKQARQASGGAAAYLQFMREELFPYLTQNYRVDLSQATYAGHSFGALFGAYVTLTAPGTFRNYILSDASLWYDDEAIFKLADATAPAQSGAAPGQAPAVLIVAAKPDAPNRSGFPYRMVENALRFESVLKKRQLNVDALVFPGEIHETLFPIAVSRGLLKFFGTAGSGTP